MEKISNLNGIVFDRVYRRSQIGVAFVIFAFSSASRLSIMHPTTLNHQNQYV